MPWHDSTSQFNDKCRATPWRGSWHVLNFAEHSITR